MTAAPKEPGDDVPVLDVLGEADVASSRLLE